MANVVAVGLLPIILVAVVQGFVSVALVVGKSQYYD